MADWFSGDFVDFFENDFVEFWEEDFVEFWEVDFVDFWKDLPELFIGFWPGLDTAISQESENLMVNDETQLPEKDL